ncbi:MAG: Ppx/GppA phosphatase family protein [Actinomycetota bacterium]
MAPDATGSNANGAAHVAAIDIGTNSFHLLVAEVGDDGEFSVLTTEKETVRLGEGPGDIRELSPAAMERGIAALKRFAAIAASFDASVDAVATSAVREADNGSEFVERAREEAGIRVEVIPGVEEARLIHLGVLQALPLFDRQLLLVDIGGGSTEFLIGKSGRTLAARSIKLGHLRLTNRFFPNGDITADGIDECRQFVRAFLSPIAASLGPLGHQVAVGSSGTATSIGEMIRLRRTGDTGSPGLDVRIDRDGLEELIAELTQWPSAAERAENVEGLSVRRSDVIVAGALLLHEIFLALDISEMVTSPFALREGVLLDRTHGIEGGTRRLADLRRESLLRMAEDYEEDLGHVEHATRLALEMFDDLAPLHELRLTDRELLEAAGLLHNVGLFVSHAAHHQHSEYIIRNSDRLTGYNEREIEVIAQVARYHRRSAPKSSHPRYMALSKSDQRRVSWMAGILRVAIALDRTRSDLVTSVHATFDDQNIEIRCKVAEGADPSVEVYMANDRSSLLAKVSRRLVGVHDG